MGPPFTVRFSEALLQSVSFCQKGTSILQEEPHRISGGVFLLGIDLRCIWVPTIIANCHHFVTQTMGLTPQSLVYSACFWWSIRDLNPFPFRHPCRLCPYSVDFWDFMTSFVLLMRTRCHPNRHPESGRLSPPPAVHLRSKCDHKCRKCPLRSSVRLCP